MRLKKLSQLTYIIPLAFNLKNTVEQQYKSLNVTKSVYTFISTVKAYIIRTQTDSNNKHKHI